MPNKGTLISDGVYALKQGDKQIGTETWRLEKLGHGGLVFTSNAELAVPPGQKRSYTYEISQHWSPLRLSLRVEEDGRSRTSEQRADGALWRAQVTPHGESAKDSSIAFSAKHQLGFPSPLFSAVALSRLNLQIGKSVETQAIVLNSQTLEPQSANYKLSCVAEEQIKIPAGSFAGWKYIATTAVGGAASSHEDTLWADPHGTILKYVSGSGIETVLTHYRRIGPKSK